MESAFMGLQNGDSKTGRESLDRQADASLRRFHRRYLGRIAQWVGRAIANEVDLRSLRHDFRSSALWARDAFWPSHRNEGLAAFIVGSKFINHFQEVCAHRVTMTKKKEKQPKDMKNLELAVFSLHPKVLKHAHRHIARLNAATRKEKAGK